MILTAITGIISYQTYHINSSSSTINISKSRLGFSLKGTQHLSGSRKRVQFSHLAFLAEVEHSCCFVEVAVIDGIADLLHLHDPEFEAGFKMRMFIFGNEEVHFSDLWRLNLIFCGVWPQFGQDQFDIRLALANQDDTDQLGLALYFEFGLFLLLLEVLGTKIESLEVVGGRWLGLLVSLVFL